MNNKIETLNPDINELLALVRTCDDVFDKSYQKLCRSIGNLNQTLERVNILPIEVFKTKQYLTAAETGEWPEPVKWFESSGTTGQKSLSPFSSFGLALYEEVSVKTFCHVLRRFFGDYHKLLGFSLVPRPDQWPHSSLAHMVDAISKVLPVNYVSAEQINQVTVGVDPIWLFGTAGHFLELAQKRLNLKLPPGSLIFETGGTKSLKLSEPLDQDGLHQVVARMFNIETHQIISEYGMSELACQAYSWHQDGIDRCYHWPFWVSALAIGPLQTHMDHGFGALGIYDPLRIDVPMRIRTQDLIELANDGSFVLKGRVPKSVLKGCSSMVPRVEPDALLATPDRTKHLIQVLEIDLAAMTKRAKAIVNGLATFAMSSDLLDLLIKEFANERIAAWALADLNSILLRSPEQLLQAAIAAVNLQSKTEKRVTIILPNNHSFAGIEPILLGLVIGKRLTVRLPRLLDQLLIGVLCRFLQTLGQAITIVDATMRIEEGRQETDSIMVFGSDQTIQQLQGVVKNPLISFGNVLAHIRLKAETLGEYGLMEQVIQKSFGLAQRGCMCPRALMIETNDFGCVETFARSLSLQAENILNLVLEPAMQIALDQEIERYESLGAQVIHRRSANTVVIVITKGFDEGVLSHLPYVLPIAMIDSKFSPRPGLFNLKYRWQGDSLMNYDAKGQPPKAGQHIGRPYFVIDKTWDTDIG